VFDRVVCGVDGSDEALEAVRQAARLSTGRLTLVAAVDPWDLVLGGCPTTSTGTDSEQAARASRLRLDAAEALDAARTVAGKTCTVESRLIDARPAEALIREAERSSATMIAVGTHGRGRLAGIALGSVATAVAHRSPCSVLVARHAATADTFPAVAVVGVDGSDESALACAAARDLHERLGTQTRFVAAGRRGDPEAARALAAPHPIETSPDSPVQALVAAARDADLVIVGSRGLHGLRALGSVSERTVHAAPCSVLVVRPPAASPEERQRQPVVVRDVMSAPAIVATEETRLDEVARKMIEHEIGAIPIVSAEGNLVGIVSESDFAGRELVFAVSRYGHEIRLPRVLGEWVTRRDLLEEIYEASRQLTARAVMSAPVHVASEDEPVQQALARLLHHDIDHMPVVRGGVPVGMLARHDLVRLALRTWEQQPGEAQR